MHRFVLRLPEALWQGLRLEASRRRISVNELIVETLTGTTPEKPIDGQVSIEDVTE